MINLKAGIAHRIMLGFASLVDWKSWRGLLKLIPADWQELLSSAVVSSAVLLMVAPSAMAQSANQHNDAANAGGHNDPHAGQKWIARDPRTGRWYEQQLQTVDQSVTRWEWKPVERSVYIPQQVTQFQPTIQTFYVPQTQYVLRAKRVGWNPIAQPRTAFEYVPYTTWVPRTATLQQPVTTQTWAIKKETVLVPQPLQTRQKIQQLVQTEIAAPAPAQIALRPTQMATQPVLASLPNVSSAQPLVSIPIFGRQPRWMPVSPERYYPAPLPVPRSSQTAMRDALEVGMQPTIVR